MREDYIRKIVREIIREEIAEELDLDEVTSSGAAGPFMTPMAFTGGKEAGEARRKRLAQQAGYTLSGKTGEDGGQIDESRTRYQQFKTGEGSPKQKIGRALSEVNRTLTELSRLIEMSAKLKVETNTESSELWKRTLQGLSKMENKLMHISRRIREIKS